MRHKNVIRIKPHHFVDIITSLGAGTVILEPNPYGHAVHIVSERILRDQGTLLEIVELGADDICEPCKHNSGGICDDTTNPVGRPDVPRSKQQWNRIVDQRWCERLNVKQGDRLTARELCERLRDFAGDIADIYRETPGCLTNGRARSLMEGIEQYLV